MNTGENHMKSITELMQSYAAYHRDPRNKATHFIGVPLIVYALFLLLSVGQLAGTEESAIPITAATVGFVVCMIYYLRLDLRLALLQLPFSAVPLYFANQTANQVTLSQALWIFLATFIIGWVIQFIGHYFEGKKPALFDNIMQVFNAPLFLAMELAFTLGWCADLRKAVEAEPSV
jgi:uncharacterized membrane protein YGL010W